MKSRTTNRPADRRESATPESAIGGCVTYSTHPHPFNLGDVLDCAARFPDYADYLRDKLQRIDHLEYLLTNPKARARRENKKWLSWWIAHYKTQILNTCRWLLS